jgi:hypothetical protein
MSETADMLAILHRIEERLGRIEGALPHIASKADVASVAAVLPSLATAAAIASKPNRAELWGAMAAMVALFALVLSGLSFSLPHLGGHG